MDPGRQRRRVAHVHHRAVHGDARLGAEDGDGAEHDAHDHLPSPLGNARLVEAPPDERQHHASRHGEQGGKRKLQYRSYVHGSMAPFSSILDNIPQIGWSQAFAWLASRTCLRRVTALRARCCRRRGRTRRAPGRRARL